MLKRLNTTKLTAPLIMLFSLTGYVPAIAAGAIEHPIKVAELNNLKPQEKAHALPVASKEITSNDSASITHQLADLTQHSWRAINDGEIFTFRQNGQFDMTSKCASYTGKYKASDAGALLITELGSTSNHCPKESNDTLMLNSLILCQRFEISANTLTLSSDNKMLINLESSNISAPQYTPKKKHSNSHSKHKSHKQTRKTARSKNTKHPH